MKENLSGDVQTITKPVALGLERNNVMATFFRVAFLQPTYLISCCEGVIVNLFLIEFIRLLV